MKYKIMQCRYCKKIDDVRKVYGKDIPSNLITFQGTCTKCIKKLKIIK